MIECRLCTLVFNSDLLSPIIMIILARHYNMIEILKISIQYDKLSTPQYTVWRGSGFINLRLK